MAKCAASGGMVDISALSIEEPEEQPAGWRNRQTQGLKSLRLLEDADIYQTANNCRTGMEMIEKYYAAHSKTQLDAAAINIMRPCPKKKAISKEGPGRVGVSRLAGDVDFRCLDYDEAVANFPRAWRNGRRSGLEVCLSAHRETDGVELLKVGET